MRSRRLVAILLSNTTPVRPFGRLFQLETYLTSSEGEVREGT